MTEKLSDVWAWYVSRPGYFGIWLSNEKVAKDVARYYRSKSKSKENIIFLAYRQVPEKDKNIINHHASIDDLIL